MRKTILYGSLLAVFLLLVIPNVSAVEYHNILDVNKLYFMEKFNTSENELNDLIRNVNIKKFINNNRDLNEIFNILLNIYGIIFNAINIVQNSEYASLHFIYMIVHIFLLSAWLKSD